MTYLLTVLRAYVVSLLEQEDLAGLVDGRYFLMHDFKRFLTL